MAIQHVLLLPAGGVPLEIKAEEAVATQLLADFGTIPDPEKQEYAIKVGNINEGYRDGTLAVDWENSEWVAALVFEATEQPPP